MANPSTRDWPASVLIATRLVSLAVVCAALYWGQAVLVPLVLAALLTILLSPLVTRLDRLRVPRVVGVLLVMALAGGLIGGVGYVVAGQLRSFATELPMHRQNIRAKIRQAIDFTRGGAIEHVQDTIDEINDVVEEDGESAPSARERRRRDDEPLRVTVEDPPALLGNAQWLTPLFGAVGTVGLTLLLAIFMLIKREDLRDRLVSLSGRPSLVVATKAFTDAGARITRYLVMQFIVNASMGIAVGIGLYFIGVEYAALWGLAAGVLRYMPYVGPWVAALLPITVSLVTTPGWEQVAMVVGLFIVLELLSNNVMEPLLYGHSVGLSELAVIVAAIFWTWLWGPIGLVIATPLTACLVVLAAHVPALSAIGRLLGERPALKPHETIYQRLLACDVDEADAIVTRCVSEHSRDEALQVLLDAVLALKRDLQASRVSAEDGELVLSGVRDLLEELDAAEPPPAAEPAPEHPVLMMGVPGRDPIDAVVLDLARVLLRGEPLVLEVLSTDLMIGEALTAIEAKAPAAVVVPSLPPAGLAPARQLCMRVHARIPALPLVAARLGDPESELGDRAALLETAGCAEVATSLGALKSTLGRIARAAARGAPTAGTARAASGKGR
ncbi:MAG TPA: AI-2E family transporter [Gammaproteobacteria bacterium]|nr:AI-2E family transporter [Gammaproteobacteria bacterium]